MTNKPINWEESENNLYSRQYNVALHTNNVLEDDF
jgi:hypothetical protein